MRLIVGLGNPGREYERTRHNTGFILVDALAATIDAPWEQDTKKKAVAARGVIDSEAVICLKPQTYMNLSGEAVTLFMNYYKLQPADVLVIHDDVDLPIGTVRLKKNGGDGGHKGVASIHQHLGSADFLRLRVGVGREEWFAGGETHKSYSDAAGFVLGSFSAGEMDQLTEVTRSVIEAVRLIVTGSLSAAMNQVNRAQPSDSADTI